MKKAYQTAELQLIHFSDVIITSTVQFEIQDNGDKPPTTPMVPIGGPLT